MIHISLGGLVTIHAEGAWAYGLSPAWKVSHFGREFVLDIPYCRVIISPALREAHRAPPLSSAEECFFNRVGWNSDDRQKPMGADQPFAGTAED